MKKKVIKKNICPVDESKNIWFKAKCYGFGWYPATWQAWSVLVIWAILFILIVSRAESEKETMFKVVIPATLITVALIIISYLKGEKPCWRWGK
jgi:hypothetical protein